MREIRELPAQGSEHERRLCTTKCDEQLARERGLFAERKQASAIDERVCPAALGGKTTRKAKAEVNQVGIRRSRAVEQINHAVDDFVIARQRQLAKFGQTQRRISKRRIDAPIRDVLSEEALKESAGDLACSRPVAPEGKVDRDRVTAPREQLVITLPQQL